MDSRQIPNTASQHCSVALINPSLHTGRFAGIRDSAGEIIIDDSISACVYVSVWEQFIPSNLSPRWLAALSFRSEFVNCRELSFRILPHLRHTGARRGSIFLYRFYYLPHSLSLSRSCRSVFIIVCVSHCTPFPVGLVRAVQREK